MIQETIIDPTTLEGVLNNIRTIIDFGWEMVQHPFVQGFIVGGGTGSMLGFKKVRNTASAGAKAAKNIVTKPKK